MIGICPIIYLLAQLQLAAENDHFKDRVALAELDFKYIDAIGYLMDLDSERQGLMQISLL